MRQQGSQDGTRESYSISRVYEQFHSQVVRFFLSKGMQRDAAEDLGQEVFYRVLRSGKVLSDEAYARNLVFCIAQNLLIDHFRKNHGPVQERTGTEDDVASADTIALASYDSPEDAFISSETSSDVHEVLSQLPDRHAQAIMLRELEGMSYREMATKMGMSEKAAESLLHRARVQLKTDLAKAGERRGGWWSIFPVSATAFKRAVTERAASAPRSIMARIAAMSATVSSAGLGHSLVTLLVAILLVGSAVGAGAVVSAYEHQGQLTRLLGAPQPGAEPGTAQLTALPGVYVPANQALETEAPEATTQAPVVAVPEQQVADSPLPTAGLVAGVVGEAGSRLELMTSELGKYLSALADPLLSLLGNLGLPPELSELLSEVVSLDMVTDIEHLLVTTGVATANVVDGALQTLIPAGIPALSAPAAAAPAPQPGPTSGSQENTATVQTDTRTTTPADAPAETKPPAKTTPAVEPQPTVAPPTTDPVQPTDPLTEVVEDVVELVDGIL